MYPYDIVLGMGLYEILLAVGVVAAMVIFRILSDKRGLDVRLHNFILADTVITVILGYVCAVLTQALYNGLAGEGFAVNENTGATFLGGLVGGAAIFLGVYYGVGHFLFRNKLHIAAFPSVSDIIGVCIPAAHAFGRLGCLMAGCCYGHVTDAWYGVCNVSLGVNTVPLQLFESLFLFALCAFLWFLVARRIRGELALYMIFYGIWRFVAEYFRGDDRGATFVSFLTPSQLTSIFLVLGGVVLWFILRRATRPAAVRDDESRDGDGDIETNGKQ